MNCSHIVLKALYYFPAITIPCSNPNQNSREKETRSCCTLEFGRQRLKRTSTRYFQYSQNSHYVNQRNKKQNAVSTIGALTISPVAFPIGKGKLAFRPFCNISQLEVDAIVNAAKSSLLGGFGVDGAIHSIAGPQLREECRTLSGCRTREAKITSAYRLPCKYVLHTVGPRIGYTRRPTKAQSWSLSNCYWNSLRIAEKNKLRTIAFPCISTGVYNFPKKEAANIANKTVIRFLERKAKSIQKVIFCVFDQENVQISSEILPSITAKRNNIRKGVRFPFPSKGNSNSQPIAKTSETSKQASCEQNHFRGREFSPSNGQLGLVKSYSPVSRAQARIDKGCSARRGTARKTTPKTLIQVSANI